MYVCDRDLSDVAAASQDLSETRHRAVNLKEHVEMGSLILAMRVLSVLPIGMAILSVL